MNYDIIAYSDGAYSKINQLGGWAYLILDHTYGITDEYQILVQDSGSYLYTTSNRMELIAFVKAVEYIVLNLNVESVLFFSDSEYLVKGYNAWMYDWVENDWLNSTLNPVKNKDLWKFVYNIPQTINFDLELRHIKGHSNNTYNEMVDKMAKKETKKMDNFTQTDITYYKTLEKKDNLSIENF